MITPFQLDAAWRDYWNLYSAPSNAMIAPLADSKCYAPRIRMVPDTANQIMPSTGKIEYNFTIPPASLIWGMWWGPDFPQFTMQITDVAIEHRLFQEPAFTTSLPSDRNIVSGNTSAYGYSLLPTPWPVVGDGLFTLEIWPQDQTGIGQRFYIILGYAEVVECRN